VYNTTRNLWACCVDSAGIRNCGSPSEETFAAPGPDELLPYFPRPVQAYSSVTVSDMTAAFTPWTSSTLSALLTSTPSAGEKPTTPLQLAPSASQTEEAPLSTGAKTGIGVGAALGGLTALALLGAVFHIWRRHHSRNEDSSYYSPVAMNHAGRKAQVTQPQSPSTVEQLSRDRRSISELYGDDLHSPAAQGANTHSNHALLLPFSENSMTQAGQRHELPASESSKNV
jgi:hypothetical protein